MLEHPLLAEVKLLVLANKQDLEGALSGPEIAEKLELDKINNHHGFAKNVVQMKKV